MRLHGWTSHQRGHTLDNPALNFTLYKSAHNPSSTPRHSFHTLSASKLQLQLQYANWFSLRPVRVQTDGLDCTNPISVLIGKSALCMLAYTVMYTNTRPDETSYLSYRCVCSFVCYTNFTPKRVVGACKIIACKLVCTQANNSSRRWSRRRRRNFIILHDIHQAK